MSLIFTILWFLLALGILVTIHEFGHFYVARRCGVKVIRFSVGFGKPLYIWKDGLGTEYAIAAIPLGGYVKMLDEREGEVDPDELDLAFTQKTVWQRMAIVVAGPVANFILAIVLYCILSLMGGSGIAPVVGNMSSDSPAFQAGLEIGDEILAVDNKVVRTWSDVFSELLYRVGDTGTVELLVVPHDDNAQLSKQRKINIRIDGWLREEDQPDLFAELGIARFMPDGEPVVDQVLDNSAALKAGLLKGDRVLSADFTPINTWREWVSYVQSKPDEAIELLVERDNGTQVLTLIPESRERDGRVEGYAGVATASITWPESMVRDIDYTLWQSIQRGFTQTYEQSTFIVLFIKKLIFAEISTKNLSGSFTIAQVAGDSARAGLSYYLSFLAVLSVSLGVFNLLPIPVLDGGHLLYYVIEVVKGSPVSDKIQMIGYQLGLFVIVSLMVLAHVNDIVRLLS